MTTQQGAHRQKYRLRLLVTEHGCPPGETSMSHDELGQALEGDKGNSSHSRRPLESKGWIVIDRTASGRAAYLALTPEGLESRGNLNEVVIKKQNTNKQQVVDRFLPPIRGALHEGEAVRNKVGLFPHWCKGCFGELCIGTACSLEAAPPAESWVVHSM
jgi:hypothetical protein